MTFGVCVLIILAWAASGPWFHFSDTWQLVINTGTTVVTFLMVFLIQNTQNRDSAAIQTKLDELIRSSAAQNAFLGIEHLTEDEVDEIRKKCEERAQGRRCDLRLIGSPIQVAAALPRSASLPLFLSRRSLPRRSPWSTFPAFIRS